MVSHIANEISRCCVFQIPSPADANQLVIAEKAAGDSGDLIRGSGKSGMKLDISA